MKPLADSLRETRSLPEGAQWAHVLRNHDELDLSRLAPEEREALRTVAPGASVHATADVLRASLVGRRITDARRNRTHILDVAERHFAEHGVDVGRSHQRCGRGGEPPPLGLGARLLLLLADAARDRLRHVAQVGQAQRHVVARRRVGRGVAARAGAWVVKSVYTGDLKI